MIVKARCAALSAPFAEVATKVSFEIEGDHADWLPHFA